MAVLLILGFLVTYALISAFFVGVFHVWGDVDGFDIFGGIMWPFLLLGMVVCLIHELIKRLDVSTKWIFFPFKMLWKAVKWVYKAIIYCFNKPFEEAFNLGKKANDAILNAISKYKSKNK